MNTSINTFVNSHQSINDFSFSHAPEHLIYPSIVDHSSGHEGKEVALTLVHSTDELTAKPNSLGIASSSNESGTKDRYKLHLVLDKQSYARLVDLKGALRATSFAEVIRRALQAYEIFDPDDVGPTRGAGPVVASKLVQSTAVEHVYVKVPTWIKDILDSEKRNRGNTYGETVRQSLRVLFQLIREREKLLNHLRKGDSYDGKNSIDKSYLLALI